MKIKIRKASRSKKVEEIKVAKNSEPDADELGAEYESRDRQAKEAAKALEGSKEKIKLEATMRGVTNGKGRTLAGKKYEVGYQLVDGRSAFNAARAKKLLKPEIWAQCLTPQVDEAKIEKLVMAKKIDKKIFLKCFDVAVPSKRIFFKKF